MDDIIEVTVSGRGALDATDCRGVVDAFNALTFDTTRGRIYITDRTGIHIYLRTGTDIHIYPRRDKKMDVVRIDEDVRVRYIAIPNDTFLNRLIAQTQPDVTPRNSV